MYCLLLLWGYKKEIWVVVTETIGPTKPKIFTFWPFIEKVCWSCSKQLKENYSFYAFFTVLLYDITFHLWSLWNHFNLGQRSIFAFSRWLSSCPKPFPETAHHSLWFERPPFSYCTFSFSLSTSRLYSLSQWFSSHFL